MEAKAENRASPQWRTLYEAAILELDCDKVPQRIAEAKKAIAERMVLTMSDDSSEAEVLTYAQIVLDDLHKMAVGNGGRTQQVEAKAQKAVGRAKDAVSNRGSRRQAA